MSRQFEDFEDREEYNFRFGDIHQDGGREHHMVESPCGRVDNATDHRAFVGADGCDSNPKKKEIEMSDFSRTEHTLHFYAGVNPYDEFKKNMLEKWSTPEEQPDISRFGFIWYVKIWGNGNVRNMPQVVSENHFSELDYSDLLEPFHADGNEFTKEYPGKGYIIYKVEVLSCTRYKSSVRTAS